MHRTVVAQRLLEPGSDLTGAFIKAMAAHVDDGWEVGAFSSSQACAFCALNNDRRMIAIEYDDPTRPAPLQYSR